MRIDKKVLATSVVVVVLAVGVASASAAPAEISFEASGLPAPAGTTFEATAANGKLTDHEAGYVIGTCATVSAAGEIVRSPGAKLKLDSLTFAGCTSPLIGPFAFAATGLPWYLEPNSPAGPDGYPIYLGNFAAAGLALTSPLGCTSNYSLAASPGGFTVNNVSGGSEMKAVNAGSFRRLGGCLFRNFIGLTAGLRITKINGVAVTTSTNLWAS